MPRPVWISSLRSNRSASLPQTGVETVSASSVDVTTHVYEDWLPPRSLMMRGSAVETTVLDRIATNMPSISPDIASSTWRWVMPRALSSEAGESTVTVIKVLRVQLVAYPSIDQDSGTL